MISSCLLTKLSCIINHPRQYPHRGNHIQVSVISPLSPNTRSLVLVIVLVHIILVNICIQGITSNVCDRLLPPNTRSLSLIIVLVHICKRGTFEGVQIVLE